ncbi:sulfurtransferase [Aliamphritea hakodatensis]|uniref:sulfurtransferase n=1 Tax=Aliamphritea hakodatensis TaxID=2895352 RepID=UPI0022FD4EFA|nr:sulfurtransferase [Aliamphritea hakodatensis]
MNQTLISVDDLKTKVERGSALVIWDCRFNLMDVNQGRKAYQASHIPGALYVDLNKDLAAEVTDETGRHPLPALDKFAEVCEATSIRPDVQVVVYDDCGGAMAARAWWLLKAIGVRDVAVLDGGYPAWLAASAPVVTEFIMPQPSAVRLNSYDHSMIAGREEVARFAADSCLVDARTAERYNGEQEPIDPVAGHIPGALNRPLQANLSSDGRFKPADVLKAEWQALLKDIPAEQVIHYCGSGVTACHNQLAMEIAGLSGSRVYPGSWSEWLKYHPPA